MRQGCLLSPLLFNIYVRELGMTVAQCNHRLKYFMVDMDGNSSWFSVCRCVCLIASNGQDLQNMFDSISGCINEYGMKVIEKKRKKNDLYKWSKERENVEFLRK